MAMAAVLAVLLAGTVFLGLGRKADSPDQPAVATLLLSEGCRWKGNDGSLLEGQRLHVGPLRLLEGSAVLRFSGGAEMILQGDAEVDLISAASVKIHRGEAVIRAEDGAEGFTVITPEGNLVDLGTEFAVKVDERGSTELHVHEGEVAARESIVAAGEAVRFEHNGTGQTRSEVALNAPRFREALERSNARERRDLMWVYEGFDRPEGEYATGDLNNGKGWAGPWRLRRPEERGHHAADSHEGMTISHGMMKVAWPVKGGRFGMLELPPGRNIRVRQLERPIDLAKNGVVYLSFLAAEIPSAGSVGIPVHRDDLRLTFRSSDDYFGESLSFGWSKKRMPRVQMGGGGLQRALREVPEDETVFCVAKIVHSKKSTDRISFRFYRESDDLDVLEPADWDIEIEDANLDARLDLLLVTSVGNQARFIDEIRMGPSWRSVTPLERVESLSLTH